METMGESKKTFLKAYRKSGTRDPFSGTRGPLCGTLDEKYILQTKFFFWPETSVENIFILKAFIV